MRADVEVVAAHVPEDRFHFAQSFVVVARGERLTIPYRIYNREVEASNLNGEQRRIEYCVYSRHHDGYIRQRNLRAVLAAPPTDWAVPFVVRLLGEYVVQTALDVIAATDWHESIGQFALDNPEFVSLTAQQAASYWSAYYRWDYARVTDYPPAGFLRDLQRNSRR